MTRQECVIRIAKINKVFGELKYRIDIGAIPDFAAYASQFLMVNDWTADIQQYIGQEFSPYPCATNSEHRLYRRNREVSEGT